MWIWSKGSFSGVRVRLPAGVCSEGQTIVSGEVAFDADGAISGRLEQGPDRRPLSVADLHRQQPSRDEAAAGRGDDAPDDVQSVRAPVERPGRLSPHLGREGGISPRGRTGFAAMASNEGSPSTGANRSPTRTSNRSATPSAVALVRATSAASGESSVATTGPGGARGRG
jgi:hypothetical protein